MNRDIIAGYWGRRYHPPATVIAVSGHVDHDEVVDLVTEQFGAWEGPEAAHEYAAPEGAPVVRVTTRDTEQAHLVLGGHGPDRTDDRRFALGLVSHVLGGGMSSRLFTEVRERRGLAYAVYAFRLPYAESGAYGVYVGTTPHQTDQVLELVVEELDKVVTEGVTSAELDRAKGHMKGSLALAMEDTNSRMIRLGRNELTGVEHLTLDDIVARIDAVTLEEAHAVAADVFGGSRSIGAVGPFESGDLERFIK
ncbi:insulinase family protein [bacterium]|nr:insulinase family protein [bacterium]